MEKAWKGETRKKYDAVLSIWKGYCDDKGGDWLRPSIDMCVDFLAGLHAAGKSYSAINVARSALSAVVTVPDGMSVGEHRMVRRLMKGIFVSKPPTKRPCIVWDVNVVLKFLREQGPAEELSLRDLSHYVVTLLSLLTGQRCQTLAQLSARDIVFTGELVRLRIVGLLKTSRPGHHMGELVVKSCPKEPKLCPVAMLKTYVARTEQYRQGKEKVQSTLFISYGGSHGAVGPSTIGRWVKAGLREAGIRGFSAHSARAAAGSAAKERMPVDQILKNVGWASESTFAKHYDRPIASLQSIDQVLLRRFESTD